MPRPGPGEVLVAMRACGICGSDLMDWYVAQKAPAVLGHEPAGVVVESRGPGLPAAGHARVRPPPRAVRRVRATARRGRETLCALQGDADRAGRLLRADPRAGAERRARPAGAARTHVSDEAATLIEPLACCVRGLDRARVDAHTRLLVIGGGQMGLLIAQAALARGAAVTVAEPLPRGARWPRRSAPARSRRTKWPSSASSGGPPTAPRRAPTRRPPDVVMLATGAPAAWDLALAAADKGGGDPVVRPRQARAAARVRRQRAVLQRARDPGHLLGGPARHPRGARRCIASGADRAERLITHRFPLEQTAAALAMARSREGIKVIVTAVRAALLHGPGDLRIEDVAEPVAGPGEVVLRDRRRRELRAPTSRASGAGTRRSARTRRGSGTSSPASSSRSARA